ncbi:MAG TPA: hypothetical protein VFU31_29805 [Candidatus Binatia bacterium]|nr:hypothetical protein [Candidatus Binatia bacterium]
MPNHVINEVIFRNVNAEQQGRILSLVQNDEGRIDFELLVPAPKNIWWGNTSSKHTNAFRISHLDWARENWGTKWNAYGMDEDGNYKSVVPAENSLTLTFQTAWGPPYGWLVALFNTLKISFEHNWFSEGESRGHHAIFDQPAMQEGIGDPWREVTADDDMQRHLHKLLWGVEKFEDED